MINLAAEHLRRLESLLATARADYDMLDYVVLEGPVQVTYHSLNRTVIVPIGGNDVGHISGMLAETLLNPIAALEKEIVEGHAQIVAAADDQLVDQQELATYRQQKRAAPALEADSAPAEASQPLAPDEHPL